MVCSRGGRIFLQGVYLNHQGWVGVWHWFHIFFPILPFFFSFFLCPTPTYGVSYKTVTISYWPLRIRSQMDPHPCLLLHHHFSPRSSPLLSKPQHIVPFQFLLRAKLFSTLQFFPFLQLIYIFSRLFPAHPSELSLNVTLLKKYLSSICWNDGWVGGWVDGWMDGWGGLSDLAI